MSKDYKDTLNLPRTDFPMKANLTQKEPMIMKFWDEKRLYETIQEKRKGSPLYILHDGPPYANGNIHIGHALNKILKDIIVKYKSMKGFSSPYIPGWDCHGLPIELQVDKKLGNEKDTIDILRKRNRCREYAENFVAIQSNEFKRLGVFGDWDNPYLTMSYTYEATIVREFSKFVEAGYVFKGKKPVYWCPSCITALAEAEVEYAEKESPSIYVKFPVDEENIRFFPPLLKGKKLFVLIWTTTPWTLPANLALAFHPHFIYVAVEYNDELYIVAQERFEALKEQINLHGKPVQTFSGKEVEGMYALHPFIKRESTVVMSEFVSSEEGTGIVHIAPGHGEDDYEIGLKYNLDIYAPVDNRGMFTFSGEEKQSPLHGKFVFKANAEIIDILKKNNLLLREDTVIHSYPHCWRCKKPVIFRATEQWFISMEKHELRNMSLSEIDKIVWIPAWGKDRIHGMVYNRPDWCISRQRAWGVPITLVKCKGCNEFVTDHDVLSGIVKLVEAHGADIWFLKKAEDFLPSGYACSKCDGTSFIKETDILDVWFDSGVSHAAVIEKDERLSWPADLYLEGSDQHRGWFQSSLLTSVGTKGKAPYRTVLTHGFVVDGQGKKMSKSLGNVVAPQEVIKSNGAEILRLWVSAEDYREDVRISREILDRLTEAYRKIRNTCRFLLGNLYDFDNSDYSKDILEIDRWALCRLQSFIQKVSSAYEHFEFHEVFHSIYHFCIVDMSSFYLDVLKDRLYTFRSDSRQRRASQWVLSQILSTITRLMAPILSFTAEEIWQNMKNKNQNEEFSVFLSQIPEVDKTYLDKELEKKWEDLFNLRNEVNKAIEIKRGERLIGNSLEAKITIKLPEKFHVLLPQDRDFLQTFFIVSSAQISHEEIGDSYKSLLIKGLKIRVDKAPGRKCQRCWNYSESVGTFGESPDICERCHSVIFNQ